MSFNPLIAVPSPRDIPSVKKALKELPADVLWVKYYTEHEAYAMIRRQFLKQTQYTHLIICPDDLVVNKQAYEFLAEGIKTKPDFYQVLCGVAGIDKKPEHKDLLSITSNVVSVEGGNREYKWVVEPDPVISDPKKFYDPIVRVGFAGFPFMIIRRDVVEQIELVTDGSCCVDVMFCYDCHKRGIPIYADLRAKMEHLKIQDGVQPHTIWVGGKPPTCYLEKTDREVIMIVK